MKTRKHHPDYDPEVEAGSVYITKEQAEATMVAIAEGLRSGGVPDALKDRVLAAATAINNVFSLGVERGGKK
jgi:hypothetical protein